MATFSTLAYFAVRRTLQRELSRSLQRRPSACLSELNDGDGLDVAAPEDEDRPGWLGGEDLARGLALLRPRDAAVLRATYLEGRTLEQAADRLGVSRSRVQQLRDRALAALRVLLTEPEDENDDEPFNPREALRRLRARSKP